MLFDFRLQLFQRGERLYSEMDTCLEGCGPNPRVSDIEVLEAAATKFYPRIAMLGWRYIVTEQDLVVFPLLQYAARC